MDFAGGKRLLLAFVAGLLWATTAVEAATPPAWKLPEEQIAEAWRVRKEVLSLERDVLDKKELDRIDEIRSQYGLTSVPVLSLALLKEIQDRPDDPIELQHQRLAYARKFSPDLATNDYFFCNPRQPLVGYLDAVQLCVGGLRKQFRQNESRLLLLTNTYTVVFRTFSIFFALFLIYLWLRYRAPVSHSWAHRFRRLSPSGVSMFGLALIFLSWILIGWLGPALFILIALWRYISLGEKMLSAVLLALSASFPFALYAPALHLNYERGVVPVIESPLKGVAIPARAQALDTWVKGHPSDVEALFSLALIEKNVGRYPQARELLENALKANPGWSKPAINLANIDYAEGKISLAINRLQNVSSASPTAIVAHFNLGKILYRQNRLDEGNAEHQKAKDIDGERFSSLDKMSIPNDPRRFLIDETLNPKDLIPRIWSLSPDVDETRDRFLNSAFPMLPLPAFWIVLGCALLLAVVSAQIWRVPRQPRLCEKCGLPSCAICDPLVQHESLCSQCYHTFVRLESIDTQARRNKERDISRHRIFRDIRERWLTLVLPGMHQFFRGNPGRAFFTLAPALASALLFLPHRWLLESPDSVPGIAPFPYRLLAIGIFNLIYLLSLFFAVRR